MLFSFNIWHKSYWS